MVHQAVGSAAAAAAVLSSGYCLAPETVAGAALAAVLVCFPFFLLRDH